MKFAIIPINGTFPELKYGLYEESQRRELECFIPDGIEWHQINYGQGEGQVEIEGCEWGFYYGEHGEITVVLHVGQADASAALNFVHNVAHRVSGGKIAFRIALVGTAE